MKINIKNMHYAIEIRINYTKILNSFKNNYGVFVVFIDLKYTILTHFCDNTLNHYFYLIIHTN